MGIEIGGTVRDEGPTLARGTRPFYTLVRIINPNMRANCNPAIEVIDIF